MILLLPMTQDRATLRSDPSGSWDFKKWSGALALLLFRAHTQADRLGCRSTWKTKAINLGGLGLLHIQWMCVQQRPERSVDQSPQVCLYPLEEFIHFIHVIQLLVFLPVLRIFQLFQNLLGRRGHKFERFPCLFKDFLDMRDLLLGQFL